MNFGIIGCGLIGKKRAQNAGRHQVTGVYDVDRAKALKLASEIPGARACESLEALYALPGLEAVVVATVHDQLAPLSLKSLKAGKHVLVEKPGALNAGQMREVAGLSRASGKLVKVGYNHRFHPALLKAKEIAVSGIMGPLMFLRARYGHGGRPGYDKEWRAVKEKSGGGELIDQGVHLIDLSRALLGDFTQAEGYLPTYFWKMEVEDNAFLLLKTAQGQAAWLHATWTEWKNLFCLELYGRDAKLQVDGLGGSYGPEKLTLYKMKPEMGPPDTEVFEFPAGDSSWGAEFEDFASAAAGRSKPYGDVQDGLAVMELVDMIYAKKSTR